MKASTFGPYSPLKKAGEFYFSSGQVGVDAITKSAPKSVAAQTKQAIENLRQLLTEEGLMLTDVVKTTVYLTDMGDFEAMNQAYGEDFGEALPARSTVAVKELPRVGGTQSIKVEIEAIVWRGKNG